MTFTMAGRLAECLLLSYRTPVPDVAKLLPRGLELVRHGDWAFWNIVVCRIEQMRPAGLPPWSGLNYHHVAYRLLVRARLANGELVDGLYFVRSDADHGLVTGLGNVASDFKFHPAHVSLSLTGESLEVQVQTGRNGIANARLRAGLTTKTGATNESCFSSPAEARTFLKYRPLGLACDRTGRWLRLAEVFRGESDWHEEVVHVNEASWAFLDHLNQNRARLELATRVRPLEYRWRLGRKLQLQRASIP